MSCASVAEGVICFLKVWHSTFLPVWGNRGIQEGLVMPWIIQIQGHHQSDGLPFACRCLVLFGKLRCSRGHFCFREKLEWMVKHLWISKIHPFPETFGEWYALYLTLPENQKYLTGVCWATLTLMLAKRQYLEAKELFTLPSIIFIDLTKPHFFLTERTWRKIKNHTVCWDDNQFSL